MWQHLKLSGVAVAAAVAIAVPLGLWLGHIRRFSFFAISVSNIGRAVPTLALLAFFAAYLGLGFTNVAFALTLLAIPPILTNTYVGVYQVDRDTVDAARGMGMSGPEIVRRVELPLAMATIAGGVRTSAVNVIATATIAPAGRRDLARLSDLERADLRPRGADRRGDGRRGPGRGGRCPAGPGPANGDPARGQVGGGRAGTPGARPIPKERGAANMRRNLLAAVSVFVAITALGACGDDNGGGGEKSSSGTKLEAIQSNPDNKGKSLTVGSKNFTEEFILGQHLCPGAQGGGLHASRPSSTWAPSRSPTAP